MMTINFQFKRHDMTNKIRCSWCLSDPIYMSYHDNEWGKVIYDDDELFACLCLESMQAGLSWITILKKRDNFYHAFDGFNAHKIAQYDDDKIHELLNNDGIIRHQAKIKAMVSNAKAYLAIKNQQSFYDYLYNIINRYDNFPKDNQPKTTSDIPSQTKISLALSKQLKKDGFKFVGATTCYAFMQAVGMVNDHVIHCDFRK